MRIHFDNWINIGDWEDLSHLFDMPIKDVASWIIDRYELSDGLIEANLNAGDLFSSEGIELLGNYDISLDAVIDDWVRLDDKNIYDCNSVGDEDNDAYNIGIISKENLMEQLGDFNDIYMHFVGRSNEMQR